MTRDIFISYSSKDQDAVNKVLTAIESSGYSCWIAYRDIRPGHMYPDEIVEAVRSCRAMVLVYSSSSAMSPDVGNEVAKAWKFRKPVIPLRIENIPITDFLEYYIGHYQWIDAYTPPLASHFTVLVDSIADLIKAPAPQPAVPVANEAAPVTVPDVHGSVDPQPAVISPVAPGKTHMAAAKPERGLLAKLKRFMDLENPAPHRKLGAWSGLALGIGFAFFYLLIIVSGDASSGSEGNSIVTLAGIAFLGIFTLLPAVMGFVAIRRRRAEMFRQGTGRLKVLWQANLSMLKTALLASAVSLFVMLFFFAPNTTGEGGQVYASLVYAVAGLIVGPILVALFWIAPLVFTMIGGAIGLIVPQRAAPAKP